MTAANVRFNLFPLGNSSNRQIWFQDKNWFQKKTSRNCNRKCHCSASRTESVAKIFFSYSENRPPVASNIYERYIYRGNMCVMFTVCAMRKCLENVWNDINMRTYRNSNVTSVYPFSVNLQEMRWKKTNSISECSYAMCNSIQRYLLISLNFVGLNKGESVQCSSEWLMLSCGSDMESLSLYSRKVLIQCLNIWAV